LLLFPNKPLLLTLIINYISNDFDSHMYAAQIDGSTAAARQTWFCWDKREMCCRNVRSWKTAVRLTSGSNSNAHRHNSNWCFFSATSAQHHNHTNQLNMFLMSDVLSQRVLFNHNRK